MDTSRLSAVTLVCWATGRAGFCLVLSPRWRTRPNLELYAESGSEKLKVIVILLSRAWLKPKLKPKPGMEDKPPQASSLLTLMDNYGYLFILELSAEEAM